MHFLTVTVHRVDRPVGAFDCARARVAVMALDLFGALERTIDALRSAGWVVDDLDHFNIDVRSPGEDTDPVLRGLYHEAKSEGGLAWALAQPIEESIEFPEHAQASRN